MYSSMWRSSTWPVSPPVATIKQEDDLSPSQRLLEQVANESSSSEEKEIKIELEDEPETGLLDPLQWTQDHEDESLTVDADEQPCSCSLCQKPSTKSCHLSRHEVVSGAIQPRRQRAQKGLNLHVNLNEGKNGPPVPNDSGGKTRKQIWTCPKCGKTCKSRDGAIVHQRSHTGERPYHCSICKKRFMQSSHLFRHQAIHGVARPYSCSVCQQGFSRQSALSRHELRFHTNENRSKTSSDSGSGPKRKQTWTCAQCNKTCKSRDGVIIHLRTHSGERPYSCSICRKRFSQSSHLLRHQVIHERIPPFSCFVCQQGFNLKTALLRHEKRFHNSCSGLHGSDLYFRSEDVDWRFHPPQKARTGGEC